MREISQEILGEMVKRIADALHPERIYLFGSHAYGTPHRHSDLDFFVVVSDDAGDPDELATRGRASLWGILVPVDIVVYHKSDMEKWAPVRCSLAHTVVKKGRMLYAA